MAGEPVRCESMIADLENNEKMAILALLLMDGTLSGREYVEQIRCIFPRADKQLIHTIDQHTDWTLVNRIVSNLN